MKYYTENYDNVATLIRAVAARIEAAGLAEADYCPHSGAPLFTGDAEDIYVAATPWWDNEPGFRADVCTMNPPEAAGDDIIYITTDFEWTGDIDTDADNWCYYLKPALAYLKIKG